MPLYLTFALMLFCFTSIVSARVVLSLHALDLAASPSAVGLLFATFFALPVVLAWPIGRYSDRVGSRRLLMFGTACGTCAMVIPYFERNLSALYVAGTLVGFAFSFYNVLLQNLVGLLSKPNERVRNFGNASMIGASTNLLGPLIAGFGIDHSGHAIASLYVAALSFAAVMLLAIWGGALPGGSGQTTPGGGVRDILSGKGVVSILVTSSLVQVGQDLFQFYIPVYGHSIGLSASAIGGVLATYAAAAFVVRFVMPHLVQRAGEERLLTYSFYLAGFGFLLIPLFENGLALALVAFMFGLGMGCGQPITTMLLFSRCAEGRTGEALGLRQSVNNIMRVSAPTLFGFIATLLGLVAVFWINALMMAAGGWLTRLEEEKSRFSRK
ncbi:MAG TPA: MFS transporter [Burkholderiales bacterium]|nr:MFS transporter [Burkholderiales bacterium]